MDARRRARAHPEDVDVHVTLRGRGAARRRALCGRHEAATTAIQLYHVDIGTLVHTFRVTPQMFSVAVTPDGQHIISGSDDTRQGVERRQQEPREHLRRAHRHRAFAAVAAMPDGQRILSGGKTSTIRVWLLDGTLKNTFELHTDAVTRPRGAARQPARALRLERQDRQALQRQRRRRPAHLQAPHHFGEVEPSMALLPDGSASSAARPTTARIVYHGLAPPIRKYRRVNLAQTPASERETLVCARHPLRKSSRLTHLVRSPHGVGRLHNVARNPSSAAAAPPRRGRDVLVARPLQLERLHVPAPRACWRNASSSISVASAARRGGIAAASSATPGRRRSFPSAADVAFTDAAGGAVNWSAPHRRVTTVAAPRRRRGARTCVTRTAAAAPPLSANVPVARLFHAPRARRRKIG